VSEAPAISVVGLRVVVDPDVFAVDRLAARCILGAPTATMWIGGGLRLDGDLPARLRERERALQQAPAAQREAIARLASDDPRIAAQLRVLGALRDLAQTARGGADWAWDPRLDTAVEAAEAVLPAFATDRARDPSAPARGPRDLAADWAVVGTRQAGPFLDLHVAVLAIEAPLQAVRDHADRIAARTRDVAMAARYRRLAAACSELAVATRLALGGR